MNFKEFIIRDNTLWLGDSPIGVLKQVPQFSVLGTLYDFRSYIAIVQNQWSKPLSVIKSHIHLEIGSFISHVTES